MAINYSLFTPPHLRYEYCPMCTSRLVEAPGRDGRLRGGDRPTPQVDAELAGGVDLRRDVSG